MNKEKYNSFITQNNNSYLLKTECNALINIRDYCLSCYCDSVLK